MEQLSDWTALQRHASAVPRGAGYDTNLYAGRDQVDRWCEAGSLSALVSDGAVLILRDDRDFRHVYHVTDGAPALSRALRRLPTGTYVADLVGTDVALNQLCGVYADAGFTQHAFLRRMSRAREARIDAADAADAAEEAVPADAAAVAAFLERLLDPYTEQLPDEAELAGAAKAGRLLVVRRGGEMAAMLLYDLKGAVAHLRFWHVDHQARDQGVGRQLMSGFLSRCHAAKRVVLWVIGDNARSISIYRHYGFAEDGLLDRIMLLHRNQDP